jgi:hypothetical protein
MTAGEYAGRGCSSRIHGGWYGNLPSKTAIPDGLGI